MGKKAKKNPEGAEDKPASGAGEADEASMLDLLEDAVDDGGDATASTLNVSKTYARKYNERKDKEELTRAKRILADEDADHSTGSETEPEDEAAALLTGKVEDRIFDTLAKIRSKDPSIYDKSKVFFQDDDFDEPQETSGGASSSSARPGMTYKDFLRDTLLREGADAIAREEEEMEAGASTSKRGNTGKTPKQEEEELRRSIISAARSAGGEDGVEEDDGDLFTLKEKAPEELKREKESQKKFNATTKGKTGDDLMARYYEGIDLDDNEKFLRDYVVNKAWQETTSMQPKTADGEEDSGEESHLEEQDEFEKEYNFRFEMDDGLQIQGHKRFQESSVRERNDKRKRQRKEKSDRKDLDKIRRTEELKRLKNLKKQEIMRRLQQIQEVTGNEEMPLGAGVLDTDFDPEAHDEEMAQVFNDDYDAGEETLEGDELVKAPAGCQDLDVSSAASEALRRRAEAAPKAKGKKAAKAAKAAAAAAEEDGAWDEDADADEDEAWDEGGEAEEVEDDEEQDAQREVDPEEWWLCDECQKGIPGGKKRFDCTVCENYTLCIKCFRGRRHPHKFVRRRVPEAAMPPEDFKGKDPNRVEVDKVLDEYFQMDYEDIIGGDLPTRFKYTKVALNDCGLSAKQILEKSDQELNRVVPLKKLRTYRTDDNRVRKEAAWKWRNQPKLAAGAEAKDGQGEGGERSLKPKHGAAKAASGAGKGPNGMSSSRLAAYNLHADRRAAGAKPKDKRKDKRNG